MALTWDNVNAITTRKILPKLVDNIFDSNPLLKRAKEKFYEKVDGGTTINQPLNYAQNGAGGWYSGTDTLTTTDSQIITAAEYDWKFLYENITILGTEEIKNSGETAKLKLAKQKMEVAEKTMADRLGTGLYSNATDAKSIVGLQQIVGTSNTIGGISQSTYTWWAAQLNTSVTTLSLSAMQGRYSACRVDNDKPSVIMTTDALYDIYWSLLQPQQRFQDSKTASAGFDSLMFNSTPVISDSHCPSGDMYFLNEKYLHLYYHPSQNMNFEPFLKPVNQNLRVAKLYWAGAFGSSNNRMHGAFTAITG